MAAGRPHSLSPLDPELHIVPSHTRSSRAGLPRIRQAARRWLITRLRAVIHDPALGARNEAGPRDRCTTTRSKLFEPQAHSLTSPSGRRASLIARPKVRRSRQLGR
jgi:hypothetical protein